MKLHQLRYLVTIVQNGLNITAAARALHTSQPGISKQVKLLEEELGFQIFEREGRNVTRVTAAGQAVVEHATRLLEEAENIRRLSADFQDESRGSMTSSGSSTPGSTCTCTREPRSRSPTSRRPTASTSRSRPVPTSCSRRSR